MVCSQHKRNVLFSAISNRYYDKHRKLRPMRDERRRTQGQTEDDDGIFLRESPNKDIRISSLPHSQLKLYFPGRILYVEKCRVFEDSGDNLSLYTKRHSLSLLPKLLPWNKRASALPPDTPFHAHGTTADGQIITLRPEKQGKYAYCPRWASRDEFSEIVVSSTMMSDHWCLPTLLRMQKMTVGKIRVLE